MTCEKDKAGGFQFSLRFLFALTTLLSVTYAGLNWFGFLAHAVVWAAFLIGGPIVGVILGIRRFKEPNPIVNGVQAGSLGAAAGYAGAFLLLSPTFARSQFEPLLFAAFIGTMIAFLCGGAFGLTVGCLRWIGSSRSAKIISMQAEIDDLKQQLQELRRS